MATSHKKSGPSQSDRKEKDRILIASGVNLDILGIREPQIYGRKTLVDMQKLVSSHWPRIAEQHQLSHLNLEFFQSNDEAVFLGHISKGWRGIVLNPGAWTHTSVA